MVAYSPDPSAAVARTVTVPAESPVRTIRPPVDVSLVVYDTWLVPLVIDQFTVLSSALLGEVVAVRVSVEPTCTVELPEMETDVTRTSGSVIVTVFVAVTPEPSDAVARTVMLPALSSSMVHLPPVEVSD